MMCLSNHKADLGPIRLHLTDSIKRMVGRREKNHVGSDSTRRARCVTWQEVEFILLYKTGGIFTPLLHKRFSEIMADCMFTSCFVEVELFKLS